VDGYRTLTTVRVGFKSKNITCQQTFFCMMRTYMRKGRFQFVRMTCYEESILLVWYTMWNGK